MDFNMNKVTCLAKKRIRKKTSEPGPSPPKRTHNSATTIDQIWRLYGLGPPETELVAAEAINSEESNSDEYVA